MKKLPLFFGKYCYIKIDYGTASTGVWSIKCDQDLNLLKENLQTNKILNGQTEFIIQESSKDIFEQLHSIFDHGRLIVIHCTRRIKEGLGGGAIIKMGVNRPVVRNDLEKIGSSLKWHGSLSMDYFYNEMNEKAYYIDANPRITEPVNALINGINLAQMQVELSEGKFIPTRYEVNTSNKSHSTIQALFAAAGRRYSRYDVLKEMYMVTSKKGIYKNIHEGVTPVAKDLPSVAPLIAVFLQLLYNPKSGSLQAHKAISNYSLGSAIPKILNMSQSELTELGNLIK